MGDVGAVEATGPPGAMRVVGGLPYMQILVTVKYKVDLWSKDVRCWFIPSSVSGRGYKIGPVCLSVCVLVSTTFGQEY